MQRQASMRQNLAFHGDADSLFEEILSEDEGTARLTLLDPPYNTTSMFHHYGDRQNSTSWLDDRRQHCVEIRRLLRSDGSLWMHLDDAEMHYAKVMLDEVFGRKNYVGTIVWQKTLSRENRTDLSTTHEYRRPVRRGRRTGPGTQGLRQNQRQSSQAQAL